MSWYQNFFQVGQIPSNVMGGEYNLYLVILSYIIACLASYVALDMSTHLRKPTTTGFKIAWLSGGAFVMGAGIWSMHFVGMLAFIMPMQMTYDLFWTGLSMVVAVLAAWFAFLFFMIKKPTPTHYLLSGIILGAAIPTMHYFGMAGMENVEIHYLPFLFVLSILIAIVAATVALWMAVHSDVRTYVKRFQLKFISALIMGGAICGMHYTGMAAAVITPASIEKIGTFSLDPKLMSIFITTIVISIMTMALIISTSKHYINMCLEGEKDFLEIVLNNIKGSVIACDALGNITIVNKGFKDLFGEIEPGTHNAKEWGRDHIFSDFETGKILEYHQRPLIQSIAGNIVKDIVIVAKDKHGQSRILIAYGEPLFSAEGEKMGAITIYHDITEKKQAEIQLKQEIHQKEIAQEKLYSLNKKLVFAARRAGIAEMANSVLHNIGNLMNSVNVSILSLQEQLNETKFSALNEISKLIRIHKDDLNKFISEHPQGNNFIDYISNVGEFWEEKKKIFSKELGVINKNVQNIKNIILRQQSLTGSSGINEDTSVNDILEDAIILNENTFPKNIITIKREYDQNINITTDKSKLLQILVNLIRNAYEILLESDTIDKIITVRLIKKKDTVSIIIADNGKGIAEENITKIFTFGFTTKKTGHGIGLHISALSAKELGGSLLAESEGVNQGSKFILSLPIQQNNTQEDQS